VRIGPLFQAPIKGRDQLVINLTRLSSHVQPSLHRDVQMQCQFETCGDRHVLVSVLKLVGGAKCQHQPSCFYRNC
jgi:hypothetical protein